MCGISLVGRQAAGMQLRNMLWAAPFVGSTVSFSWMCLWLDFFSVQQCYLVA